MIDNNEHIQILEEFDAMIAQANGKQKGYSILNDPALARNLEWLKESYLDLWRQINNKNK